MLPRGLSVRYRSGLGRQFAFPTATRTTIGAAPRAAGPTRPAVRSWTARRAAAASARVACASESAHTSQWLARGSDDGLLRRVRAPQVNDGCCCDDGEAHAHGDCHSGPTKSATGPAQRGDERNALGHRRSHRPYRFEPWVDEGRRSHAGRGLTRAPVGGRFALTDGSTRMAVGRQRSVIGPLAHGVRLSTHARGGCTGGARCATRRRQAECAPIPGRRTDHRSDG
jgi:hypothetical protein